MGERASSSMLRRAAPALGLVLVVLVIAADPAAAHTVLRSSNPAAGATVPELSRIEIHFTEPIEVSASHLYVEDTVGFVELPKASAIDGDPASLGVDMPPLGDGTYAVTWHVIAGDGDPAEGTFSFTIDASLSSAATTTPVTLADPAADFPPDTSLAIPLDKFDVVQKLPSGHGHGPGIRTEALARVVLDLGVAVLIGGMAFLAAAWPKGARTARARQVLWAAIGLAAFASFELTAFQLATLRGLSTAQGLLPWHQWDALGFRFGRVAAVRVLLLLAAAGLVKQLAVDGAQRVRSRQWQASAAFVGVGLVQTLVLLGHSQSSGFLASAARLLHVVGISVWIGGLVMLLAVVLPRRRPNELAAVLPRFSSLATTAVAALTLGGVVLAVDLVGSVHALTSTTYGRLLMLKVAVVAVVVAVASRSRAHVQSTILAPSTEVAPTARAQGAVLVAERVERVQRVDVATIAGPLARWVAIELGLMAVVLVLTALLLTQVPPA
jgi:copper transport protein